MKIKAEGISSSSFSDQGQHGYHFTLCPPSVVGDTLVGDGR